jgi:type VI secretion system secreted protein Hcp
MAMAWIAGSALPTRGADLFLELPGIPGESTEVNHRNWISLQSLSFGISRTVATNSSTGSARATGQDLGLAKRIDLASPKLALAAASGQPLATARIQWVRQTANNVPLVQFEAVFRDVRIGSDAVSGSDTELTEQLQFSYSRMTWSTPVLDARGDSTGRIEVDWNFQTNAGSLNSVTNPPNPPPATVPVTATGERSATGAITLRWPATAGQSFRIFGSPRLDGTYTAIQDLRASTAGTLTLELNGPEAMRFFQVVRLP